MCTQISLQVKMSKRFTRRPGSVPDGLSPKSPSKTIDFVDIFTHRRQTRVMVTFLWRISTCWGTFHSSAIIHDPCASGGQRSKNTHTHDTPEKRVKIHQLSCSASCLVCRPRSSPEPSCRSHDCIDLLTSSQFSSRDASSSCRPVLDFVFPPFCVRTVHNCEVGQSFILACRFIRSVHTPLARWQLHMLIIFMMIATKQCNRDDQPPCLALSLHLLAREAWSLIILVGRHHPACTPALGVGKEGSDNLIAFQYQFKSSFHIFFIARLPSKSSFDLVDRNFRVPIIDNNYAWQWATFFGVFLLFARRNVTSLLTFSRDKACRPALRAMFIWCCYFTLIVRFVFFLISVRPLSRNWNLK